MKGRLQVEKTKNVPYRYELNKRRSLSVASLAFFAVSFLGWFYETALCFVSSRRFCDRGFLSLPFCPIYGAPVCILILLIGTPKAGRLRALFDTIKTDGELQEGWKRAATYIAYFFLSAAFATLFELFVGLYFESRGIRLWGYSSYPLNYRGMISLPVSLLWGLLFTLFATFLWSPLFRFFARIPKRTAALVNAGLWTAVTLDFLLNFLRI
ncbi:MAG: putative ABC transporter permease [Clostridia bacterium]|nr:putative ABC transporter permease [Clostridia bacterium]